jgi:chromosomal replication initiator protein
MQATYLEDHCRLAFVEAAQATLGQLVTVSFESKAPESAATSLGEPPPFEQEPQLQLNADYVFENFVVGPENRLAHAAAVAVAESPGSNYNPLFIHGDVGLGKTHLLQAICHDAERRGSCGNTLYISCEMFTNHFIEAVERGALKQFRYRYRHADMLVIDDIQFLAERERSQEEFFHTFNTLYQAQKQIVLSADCSPAAIPSLEARLISRFSAGLVSSIDTPSLETRMAIVQKKARLRCIELPEDVVKFIAARIDSNIRELEGGLIKLDALSQTQGGRIDLELAHSALGGNGRPRQVTVQEIIDVVTRRFGVRQVDLQSKKRTKSVTHPRQLCMYLVRELTNHSLEEIGGHFGGRDHTTVLHADRTIRALRAQDADFNRTVEEICSSILRNRSD